MLRDDPALQVVRDLRGGPRRFRFIHRAENPTRKSRAQRGLAFRIAETLKEDEGTEQDRSAAPFSAFTLFSVSAIPTPPARGIPLAPVELSLRRLRIAETLNGDEGTEHG